MNLLSSVLDVPEFFWREKDSYQVGGWVGGLGLGGWVSGWLGVCAKGSGSCGRWQQAGGQRRGGVPMY